MTRSKHTSRVVARRSRFRLPLGSLRQRLVVATVIVVVAVVAIALGATAGSAHRAVEVQSVAAPTVNPAPTVVENTPPSAAAPRAESDGGGRSAGDSGVAEHQVAEFDRPSTDEAGDAADGVTEVDEEPTGEPDETATPEADPSAGPDAMPDPEVPDADVEDFPPGVELPDTGLPVNDPGPLPALPAPSAPEAPTASPAPAPAAPAPSALEVNPVPAVEHPVPTPEPSVSLAPVADGAPGGLTGNAVGCASNCITTALLHKNIHDADLQLEVVTNVATEKVVWVAPAGPFVVNGLPAHLAQPPRAVNQTPGTSWDVELSGLEHDTSYRVVVNVLDQYGNSQLVSTLVTTIPEPILDMVAQGSPCQFNCITAGVVHPSSSYDKATISLESNAAVTFELAVSPSAPGTIGGNPFLPADVTLTDVATTATSYEARAIGLQPDTTYHIVARATDNAGNRQYATGHFTTAAAPVVDDPQPLPEPEETTVLTWVQRFHVHQDGDSVGRGEISFRYGIHSVGLEFADHEWYQPYTKIGAGESVPAGGFRISHVTEGYEQLPPVIVNALESDASLNDCAREVGEALAASSRVTDCDEALTAAVLDGITLDWIDTLPGCDGYAVPGPQEGTKCYVMRSANPGDDFVVFDALIVFRVV